MAIPVGAIGVMLVLRGVDRGIRAALGAAAGVATVDAAYAAAAVALGAASAPLVSRLGPYPGVIGGCVLLLVAGHAIFRIRPTPIVDPTITTTRAQHPSHREPAIGGDYLALIGLTSMNPATLLYFTSVVIPISGRVTGCSAALFVVGVAVGSLSWQAVLAVVGAVAGTRITGRRRRRTVVVGNIVVALLGVALIATSLT